MKLNKNTDYEKRAKFIASLTLVIILILLVVLSFFLEPKVELKSLQSNSIYVTQYIVRVDDNVQQANKVEQNTKLNSQSEEIKHEDTSLRKMTTETSTNKLEVIEQQKFEAKKEIKPINKEKQAQKIKTVQKKIEVKKVKSKTETSEKTKSIKKEITNFDKKKDVSNSQNKNIIKEQKEKQITKQSLDIEFNNNSNTVAVSNSNDNVNNSSLNGNSSVDVLSILIARATQLKRYPRRAQILDIEGTVELSVFIDLNGNVVQAFVSKKSNRYLLDKETEKLGEKLIGFNVGYLGDDMVFVIPIVYRLR